MAPVAPEPMMVFLSYVPRLASVAKVDGWRDSFRKAMAAELGKLLKEVTDTAPPDWKTPYWTGIIENASKADWMANSVSPQGVARPQNVLVYILDTPESSLNKLNGNPPPAGAEGSTVNYTGKVGIIAEVYAQGNLIPSRFANMIFHEIMHAKLDIGQSVVPFNPKVADDIRGIHNPTLGGGGLALKQRVAGEVLTAKNKQLMLDHFHDAVPMRTDYMA